MNSPRKTQPEPAIGPTQVSLDLVKEVARRPIPSIPMSNLSDSSEVPIASAIAAKAAPMGSSNVSPPANIS